MNSTEAFLPVLRFFVCSDTHISSAQCPNLSKLSNAIDLAYKLSALDKNHPRLDAVVFVGDITNRGKAEQFAAFDKLIKAKLKEETTLLALVATSHDSWDEGKKSKKYCSEITGLDSDFYAKLQGFTFIGTSTSKYKKERYGLYQHAKLIKRLKAAANADSQRPIFVFQHEHIKNTVYGSSSFDGWGLNYFKTIYRRYPQIIHFSGHSHYPLNDPRSIWQGDFTAVGTGAVSYMEFTVDKERKVHPDNYKNANQGWLVEVSASNSVRLRGLDAINGKVLCEHIIKTPHDKKSFDFTRDKQSSKAKAPSFAREAGLSITRDNESIHIDCPAAKIEDNSVVFLYRLTLKDKNGKIKHSEYKLNDYWLSHTMDEISFDIKASKGDIVEITAENSYYMPSEVLSATI